MELPQIELTELVKLAGYPGLFAVVFAETGIFFMFFLPGTSMLFTAGLLASQGMFNVWILIPLITLAAILGDSTGYWFGTRVGPALFSREDSRFFKKEYLERTREFYEKHGVMALVLARFVPVIRTFAPILAGIANLKYSTFLTYNITGGILWGSGVTFAGYYLAERIPILETYITPIVILIVIITTLPLLREARRIHRDTQGAK